MKEEGKARKDGQEQKAGHSIGVVKCPLKSQGFGGARLGEERHSETHRSCRETTQYEKVNKNFAVPLCADGRSRTEGQKVGDEEEGGLNTEVGIGRPEGGDQEEKNEEKEPAEVKGKSSEEENNQK